MADLAYRRIVGKAVDDVEKRTPQVLVQAASLFEKIARMGPHGAPQDRGDDTAAPATNTT